MERSGRRSGLPRKKVPVTPKRWNKDGAAKPVPPEARSREETSGSASTAPSRQVVSSVKPVVASCRKPAVMSSRSSSRYCKVA